VAIGTALLLGWPSLAWSAGGSATFSGPTSQRQGGVHFRISMNVSSTTITDVSLGALTLKGPPICTTTASSFLDFTKGAINISGGRAKGRLRDRYGNVVTITARVRPTALTGSFVLQTTGGEQGSSVCRSGTVTFDASAPMAPNPDAQYSGTSGPGYPLSFSVSATGSDVENLNVAYEATCGVGAGDVAPTFTFSALPVTNGNFSGTVHTTDDTISISGTFYGTTVSGQIVDVNHIPSLQSCTQSSSFVATEK
jgi:hypothetical protein